MLSRSAATPLISQVAGAMAAISTRPSATETNVFGCGATFNADAIHAASAEPLPKPES